MLKWLQYLVSLSGYHHQGCFLRLLTLPSSSTSTAWLNSRHEAASGRKKAKGKKNSADLSESIQPPEGFKFAPLSRRRAPSSARPLPTVARFAIAAKVPPGITQSLSLAERFHQALCAKLNNAHSEALTGLNVDGKPLTGNQHAYFLPECDLHGYLTHMTVHAPCGFSEDDSRALARLRSVWAIEGKGTEIDIVLLATGQPDDFKFASPYFRPARLWRSITPFVPVRHAKATRTGVPKIDPENGLQKGSPEHDCLRLFSLVAPDHPKPKVRLLGTRIRYGLRDIPCLDFQRQRRNGGGTRGDHRGYALELEFDEPTTIPFGLGYAAHFGLGMFAPIFPKDSLPHTTNNHDSIL